jgi:hypothetical protein
MLLLPTSFFAVLLNPTFIFEQGLLHSCCCCKLSLQAVRDSDSQVVKGWEHVSIADCDSHELWAGPTTTGHDTAIQIGCAAPHLNLGSPDLGSARNQKAQSLRGAWVKSQIARATAA